MNYQHTCKHCNESFESVESGAKYCGVPCYGKANRKIDENTLREYVRNGEFASRIARQMGVSVDSVKVAIRRHGLYEQWRSQRFA